MSTHNDDGKKSSGTDTDQTELWDQIAHVTASQYREAVITGLGDGPATPSSLTPDETAMAHYSRALQELRDEGLVELLVSEDTQKGRYYDLTVAGENVMRHIVEEGAA